MTEAERVVAARPDYGRANSVYGWACIFNGRSTEGVAALERAVELMPGTAAFLGQVGCAYAMTGDEARARAVLARLEDMRAKAHVPEVYLAYVYTGLGEHDAAIAHLEKAFEQRSSNIYGISGSYLFAPLREHPRFQALLHRMNL